MAMVPLSLMFWGRANCLVMCFKTQKLKVPNLWEIRAALYFITSVTSPYLGLVKPVWPSGSVKKTKACQQVNGEQRSSLSMTYVHLEYDRHVDFIERAMCVKVMG